MDLPISAAARLLAAGDPLGALKHIALRNDPPALSLRGIAMAQLGDYERARQLLRRASRSFAPGEHLAKARCQVAAAEVALAARELAPPRSTLAVAKTLAALGDATNALHARLVEARHRLLVGELDAAEEILTAAKNLPGNLPPALAARAELTRAELALRRVRATEAAAGLNRAEGAARRAGIPALQAEINRVRRALLTPSARLIRTGESHLVRLAEIEVLFASGGLVIDGCRRTVRGPAGVIPLHRRPVLFALLAALAELWPTDVPRDQLITRAFEARTVNESHRARLRVEISRLRTTLRSLARIHATPHGFALVPINAQAVAVLAPPVAGRAGAIPALLESGEPWTTSALALALGASQRTVQRLLRQLENTGAVRSVGRGRTRCWLAPAWDGFATTLLLPGALAVS